MVPFLLPLDFYGESKELLKQFWSAAYIIVLVTCWILVPLLQSYYDNGGFTFKDKLICSLKEEGEFYGCVILFAGAVIGIMVLRGTFQTDEVPGVIIALSNTWGLSLLILMLGYGVVEVPRVVWMGADRMARLHELYFKLASLHEDASVEQDRLQQTHAFVTQLAAEMAPDSEDSQQLAVIKQCTLNPTAYQFADITPSPPIEDHKRLNKVINARDKGPLRYKDFMALHYVNVVHGRAHRLAKAEWTHTVNEISWLLEVDRLLERFPTAAALPDSAIPPPSIDTYSTFPLAWLWPMIWPVRAAPQDTIADLDGPAASAPAPYPGHVDTVHDPDARGGSCFPQLRAAYGYPMRPGSTYHRLSCAWARFLLYSHRTVARSVAVLCGLLSVLVLWAELAIMLPIDLSPIPTVRGSAWSALALIIPLLYMCFCSFFTLFKANFGAFYRLAIRGTGVTSILHNAAFMLRLILPLAGNFFLISHDGDTAFASVHGNVKAVPFLGGTFNTYMPAFLLLFAAMTFFNCFGHIFKWLNIPRFDHASANEATQMVVDTGRRLYDREVRFRHKGTYDDHKKKNNVAARYPVAVAVETPGKVAEKQSNRYFSQQQNTMSLDDF
jgi:hypothetical protein